MISPRLRIATLMLGLAVTFSGCSLFKSSSAPDDSAIVAQIQSQLYQDPSLKTQNVRVISQKGVVVLSGTVESNEEKSAAEHLAQSAPGVKQVIDQLTVSGTPATAASQASSSAPAPAERQTRARHIRRTMAENEPSSEPREDQSANTPAPVVRVAPPSESVPSAPQPPPQPVVVTIPAGTVVRVRTVDSIDSSVNHPGEEFAATVDSPIMEGGQIVVPHNAVARIRLINSRNAGSIKGRSEVEVSLVSLRVDGRNYPVDSSIFQEQGASRGKRSAKVIGGGAGLGALIGAIAGGGKGAAIGAAVGAGGGTAIQAATKGQRVKIPSETELQFTLHSPVRMTLPPQDSAPPPQN